MSEEIFISYKSERRAAATHLSDILKAHGFSVWYDYGLISGTSFADQINEKLNAAKVVVVLWCKKSVDSPWVLHEALTAKHNGSYLPALIETCEFKSEFKPDQYIDLRHWNARPTAYEPHDLIDDIERALGRSAESNRSKLKDLRSEWTKYGSRTLGDFALTAASPNRLETEAPIDLRSAIFDKPNEPMPEVHHVEDTSIAPNKSTSSTPLPDDGVKQVYDQLDKSVRENLERFIEHFSAHPMADVARDDLATLIAAEEEDARLAEFTELTEGYDLAKMEAFIATNPGTLEAWQVDERRRKVLADTPDDETRKKWESEAVTAISWDEDIPEMRKPYIQSLDLKGREVRDLSPLSGLIALQTLYLNGTKVNDLSPISRLTALQELNLNGTQVRDVSPLSSLTALQELYLNGTQVRDLSSLYGLNALQELSLNDTNVSDLSPLSSLTALQELSIMRTKVNDLSPLSRLNSLQKLYLSHTNFRNLSSLNGIIGLRIFSLE